MKIHFPLLQLIASTGLAVGIAHAQPIRETPGGHFVTIPERVEVPLSGGAMRVVTREIGPLRPNEIPDILPEDVAVFEIDDAGALRPGISLRNGRAEAVGSVEAERPTQVYFEQGQYLAEVFKVYSQSGPFPPGYESVLPEAQRVPVHYGPLPRPGSRGPAFTLTWIQESETYPAGQAAAIGMALERVKVKFEALFAQDGGRAVVRFRFAPLGNPPLAANNYLGLDDNYSLVRFLLYTWAETQNESSQELAFYDEMPLGASIPVIFANNQTTAVTAIVGNTPLRGKWGMPQPPEDATIVMNSDKPWDFDPLNGIDVDKFDLEEVVTHEFVHCLGFTSFVEDLADNQISVWDIFRMRDSAPPPLFRTAPRMLEPNVEAIAMTLLNSPARNYRLSTGTVAVGGDGAEAAHWKLNTLLGFLIGLMNPGGTLGGLQLPAGYLTAADINAIDIMGWNTNQQFGPPAPPQPQEPEDDEPHAKFSLTPQFEWVPSGVYSHLFIFVGTSPSEATQVYSARDLLTSTHKPPYGTLSERTTYTWRVTAQNESGFAYSAERSFTTTCYANCDSSTIEPVLNVDDFTCFTNAYAEAQLLPPAEQVDHYANCDGSTVEPVINVDDFTCFINAYSQGCQ